MKAYFFASSLASVAVSCSIGCAEQPASSFGDRTGAEPPQQRHGDLLDRQLADLDMFRFNTVTYRKVEAPTDTTTSVALGVSAPAGASPVRAGAGADALRSQQVARAAAVRTDSVKAPSSPALSPLAAAEVGLLDRELGGKSIRLLDHFGRGGNLFVVSGQKRSSEGDGEQASEEEITGVHRPLSR